MTHRYICVDDGRDQDIVPLISLLRERSRGEIDISRLRPPHFEELVASIQASDPDGLIIDLRLDQEPNAEGRLARYKGTTVAQDLRTRMSEGEVTSVPIVLWSVESKLRQSFVGDDTAHDLFDRIYDKETNVAENPDLVALELQILVDGYRSIRGAIETGKGLMEMLSLKDAVKDICDPRIEERFLDDKPHSVHEYAGFILKELISHQGPLIDEEVLAARLGVDITRSRGWHRLVESLPEEARYKGVFSGAWRRWWAAGVKEWWDTDKEWPKPIQRISASQRVLALRASMDIQQLEFARPIKEDYSTCYWTICQALRKPLDPVDGLMVYKGELKSWQEPLYVSVHAALERIGKDKGLIVHPLERARLEELKSLGG